MVSRADQARYASGDGVRQARSHPTTTGLDSREDARGANVLRGTCTYISTIPTLTAGVSAVDFTWPVQVDVFR
jgi:hypothetical protein